MTFDFMPTAFVLSDGDIVEQKHRFSIGRAVYVLGEDNFDYS